MKKISVLLNITLIALIAVQSCNCPKRLTDYTASRYCQSSICMDYSTAPPFEYLDAAMLGQMTVNYNSSSNKVANASARQNQGVDARSVWLPLEKIKRFIWEIETNSCESGCGVSTKLGIRIYYGRYPADMSTYADLKGLPADYAGLHTVFMVPTFDKDDAHYDFDPRYWSKTDCSPVPLYKLFAAATDSNFIGRKGYVAGPPSLVALTASSRTASVAGNANMIQNHGELCPPLCRPKDGDDYFTQSFTPQ
jgi:hypothetical protein